MIETIYGIKILRNGEGEATTTLADWFRSITPVNEQHQVLLQSMIEVLES